jgi:hypothetical protein
VVARNPKFLLQDIEHMASSNQAKSLTTAVVARDPIYESKKRKKVKLVLGYVLEKNYWGRGIEP